MGAGIRGGIKISNAPVASLNVRGVFSPQKKKGPSPPTLSLRIKKTARGGQILFFFYSLGDIEAYNKQFFFRPPSNNPLPNTFAQSVFQFLIPFPASLILAYKITLIFYSTFVFFLEGGFFLSHFFFSFLGRPKKRVRF